MRFLGMIFAALLAGLLATGTAWAVDGPVPSKPLTAPTPTSQEQYNRTVATEPEADFAFPRLTSTVVLTSYEGVTVLDDEVSGLPLQALLASKGYRLKDYRSERGQKLNPDRTLAGGKTLFLFKVEYQSSYEQIELASPVEEIDSPFMPVGNEVVLEAGESGTALLTKVATLDLSSVKRVNSAAKHRPRKRNAVETVTVVQAPTPTTVLVGSGEADIDPATVKGLVYPLLDLFVTSPFGMRVHPVTNVYKLHDGVDLTASCGTQVTATAGGVVVASGNNGAYGNQVQIDHGGNFITSYSHLESTLVKVGDAVEAGTPIGKAGATGLVTGCHLHFMTTLEDTPLDPMGFFSE